MIDIVQRTELCGGAIVITAKRRDPEVIKQFITFTILPTSRYATNIIDNVSIGAALHEHTRLVRLLEDKTEGRND